MGDPFEATNSADDFDVDLSGASTGNDISGQFILKLLDVKSSTSKNGNPMWVWDWAIVSGANGDDRHAGRQLTSYTALTDAALWKVEEHGVSLGLCNQGERLVFKRSDAVGRMVIADIEMKEGQEGPRKFPTIGSIYPHHNGAGYRGAAARPAATPRAKPPLTGKPVPQPADRAALTGSSPRRTPPARRPAPPPVEDENPEATEDEIPF